MGCVAVAKSIGGAVGMTVSVLDLMILTLGGAGVAFFSR